jgi:hypothetical protein
MKCEVCGEECEEYDIKKLDKFDIFSVHPKEIKERRKDSWNVALAVF